MFIRYFQYFTAVVLTVALVACGGGGGGGSGGTNSASTDPVSAALSSGDARSVTKAQVLESMQSFFTTQASEFAQTKRTLFNLNADGSIKAGSVTGIDWYPSQGATYLTILDNSHNQSVLPSNWDYGANAASTKAFAFAVVGTTAAGSTRYAVFGGHPIYTPGNSDMDSFVVNTIAWLTKRSSYSGFKVVVAHQGSSSESATRNWLVSKYPGITINGISSNPASQSNDRCDNAQLDGCLQGADLVIVGNDQGSGYNGDAVMQAITAAHARGIPLMYMHVGWDATGDLTTRLFKSYSLANGYYAGNFFDKQGLKAYSPTSLAALPANVGAIQTLVNRLESGNFSTTWSGCVNDIGRVSCDNDTAYMSEFGALAGSLRDQIRTLDGNGMAIFGAEGYTLERLLVLLGDKYRESVSYSSSFTKTSDTQAFFRAYFSDIVSYSTRGYNVVARNLGNFSNLFPASTPTLSRTVSVTLPNTGTRDYATGLYVLPGRSVTLTRTDSGTGTVKMGINMLRDTTHVFQKFDRPTQLGSPRPALKLNTPLTVTNPYGGPLFLFVDAAAGQPSVTVRVEGVTTHPVLRNPNDAAEVAAFSSEVNSTATNWVVVATDALTIHSTLGNFRDSLTTTGSGNINYGGSLAALLADTWTYTIKSTYELAGFNVSSGALSLASQVSAFCNSKGWDCTGMQHRRDSMQHVISDVYSYCGGGCAGNPYDQSWAFAPVGWGESHEIGHNLQRSRLKIYDGISTEVSNNIFPNHNRIAYNMANGASISDRPTIGNGYTGCSSSISVAACMFTLMKNAASQANPTTEIYNAIWSDSSYGANNSPRVMFYRQLVEYTRYYKGSLGDGWSLYTLMYLLERNFSNSGANWASVANSYGFGTYASYPSSMNGNDFMLIASSYIIGRDMRPVFDLWGVTYSAAASTQVNAYGYAAAAKFIFPMANLDSYGAGVGAPVTVTSSATYPSGY